MKKSMYIIIYLLIVSALIACNSSSTDIGKSYEDGLIEGYESGSWATMQHHKHFGNYGSRSYHNKVMKTGLDPQNKEDILKLININKL